MSEEIYLCITDDVKATVTPVKMPEDSLMILERVPNRWLSKSEVENGICFRPYQPDEDFNRWEKGRIFNEKFEFHWKKQNGNFDVVYIGEKNNLPDLFQDISFDIGQMEIEDRAYYLWGRNLTNETLKKIGSSEDETLFAEIQIPRILDYPIKNQSNRRFRVKLIVRHYSVSSTLKFYRFLRLEEEK